jgi:hypothetical protein
VTGFQVDPGLRTGVHLGSRAYPGSFWFLSRHLRIREGAARNVASDRADFLGSHPGSRNPADGENNQ